MAVQWYESPRNTLGSFLSEESSLGISTLFEGSAYSSKLMDNKNASVATILAIAATTLVDIGSDSSTYHFYIKIALDTTALASGYKLGIRLVNVAGTVIVKRSIFIAPGDHYECIIEGDTPADKITIELATTIGTPSGIMGGIVFARDTLATPTQINNGWLNDTFPVTISGTVPVNITAQTLTPIVVGDGGGSLTVDGTVAISTNPVPVSGTVAVSGTVTVTEPVAVKPFNQTP